MPDYIVSGEQLTAIANAIREKTGNTESLTFPGGFTEGISGIETVRSIDALIDGSVTEISSNASSIRSRAFHYYTGLLSANFPKATSIGDYAFSGCERLQSVSAPNASTIGSNAFYMCSKLTTIKLPAATSVPSRAFMLCTKLTTADFTSLTSIHEYSFNSAYVLRSLILRGETVATLANTSDIFTNTKIADGTGYIYVPAALVDTYKTATNWSTYANQFRALEDYTVDGTTTGELDSTKI